VSPRSKNKNYCQESGKSFTAKSAALPVVQKSDCARDQAVKQAVDAYWLTWKDDETFRKMEDYRNGLLKEFDFTLGGITSCEQNAPQDLLLFFDQTPVDALEELQRMWQWWDLRLTEIERKSGRISDEELSKLLGQWG
jgi:hypothetical protein